MADSDSGKHVPDLGAVQETLLIPLYARAKETKREGGLLSDPKAVEIVDSMQYDFSKWEMDLGLMGCILRTILIEQDVQRFLQTHPAGTIVEIGCGLHTRFERLDNGQATWVDIDMPDTMNLRKRYFTYDGNSRRKMIAASILDTDLWMPEVKGCPGPVCFVSEATLIYIPAMEVKTCLQTILKNFDSPWLVLDNVDTRMVDTVHYNAFMKHMKPESWYVWKCDDPKATIERWSGGALQQTHQRTLVDVDSQLVFQRAPFPVNVMHRYTPSVLRTVTRGYNLSCFVPPRDIPHGIASKPSKGLSLGHTMRPMLRRLLTR